jgi:hypothetical protein
MCQQEEDNMTEWETYTIDITANEDGNTEAERGDVTDRFESELYRLIKKYQGQAGLKFIGSSSTDEPVREY